MTCPKCKNEITRLVPYWIGGKGWVSWWECDCGFEAQKEEK